MCFKKCIVFLLIALLLFGCGNTNGEGNGFNLPDTANRPYEPDTPVPDNHVGTFVSEHGSMTYSGDGESIIIDFDEELAEMTGLPSGISEGTYTFLTGDLPPLGSMPIRYDAAYEYRITVGEESVIIDLGYAAEDGKNASSYIGMVTPETIPLLISADGRFITVEFIKTDESSLAE